MSWESEFADLRKAEEERNSKEKIEADRRAAQNEADREAAEKHLKEVVIPLFEEVAAAARKSGYVGNVRQIDAQSVSGQNTAPFVRGVHLTLSRRQAGTDFHSEGFIKLEHNVGRSFSFDIRARGSGEKRSISIEDLDRSQLEQMVRRVMMGTFK